MEWILDFIRRFSEVALFDNFETMGNACCNERGDEPQAQKAGFENAQGVNSPIDTKREISPMGPYEADSKSLTDRPGLTALEVTKTDIDNFNREPNEFFRLDPQILKIIERGNFHEIKTVDDRKHYKKIEVKSGSERPYKYFGQMDGAKKSGRGQLHFLDKNGEFIICNFVDDRAQGDGAVYFANGDYFKGKLADNQLERGVLYLNNGNKYDGPFNNNMYNGEGTFYFTDGRKYKGEYVDGKKCGKGTFTWTDGSKYVGFWKNGKQNGHGCFTDSEGKTHEGEFLDGKKIKGTH